MDGGGGSAAEIKSLLVELIKDEMSAAEIKSLLGELIKDENHTIGGVDAAYLQATLQTIQGYLNDAEKKLTTEEDVEIWMRMLEAVAMEANDIFAELSNHPLPNKMRTAMDKVLSCFNHIALVPRRNMALKIKEISTDFEFINRRANELGLINVNAPVPAIVSTGPHDAYYEKNLPDSADLLTLYPDPVLVENDKDVLELVKMLLPPSQFETEISVFAIVGMSGSGKTTLARKVFTHEKMKTRFRSLIWVVVNKNFNPIILLNKILSSLTSQKTDEVESGEIIRKRLQQALKHETYLLVLDDVWNEDMSKWESFINAMLGVTSTQGNAIIITTRKSDVASLVRSRHIHSMKGLSDAAVWSIIKEKGFKDRELPSGFEMVGMDIARKCAGLPLAAHIVGAMLRDKSLEYWQQKGLVLHDEGDNVLNILKLSYDNLTPQRQRCFAICSIFPEGAEIRKQELIELWMAGGFLETSEEMKSAGNMVFNDLLQESLLLPVEIDEYGNVKRCAIQDLVRVLACYVLDPLIKVEKMTNAIFFSLREEAEEAKQNALFLKSKGRISGTMFSVCESLHLLTLHNYGLKVLPSSIRKLTLLKYLNISSTRIETLPEWIHELCSLQTLNAATESLRQLPATFKYLITLMYLYIPSHVKLPEIGRFINLRELKFSVSEQTGYRIEELGSLENLRELSIDNLEKVQNEKELERANLPQKQNLVDLQLEWDDAYRKGISTNDEIVLEGLKPSSNLEKLKIKGFRGKAFPPWILKMEAHNKLTNITLSRCYRCEEIPILGHLRNLKSLHFWTLCNVKLISSSFYGNSNCEDIFPVLETMLLSDMPELLDWEEGNFLDASGQPKVKVLPRLQSLKIYHCKKLEFLPSWLFSQAHNLSEIDIRHCTNLTGLPDGLDALNSLKSITIKCCQNLKSIIGNSSSGGHLASLVSLEIRDCQELMEVVSSLKAPLLKKVAMAELRSLDNLPSFIDCLSESPHLQELKITGVPNFTSIASSSDWPFRRLQKLEIDVRSDAIMKMVGDGLLSQCRGSLNVLILRGLEIWERLPESIGGLTALYSLELENFGGQELPDLRKLISLTRLSLSNCLKLKCLPSLRHLEKLEALYICNCPELRIESEWRKIFRRTLTYVNGHLV